MLLALTRRLILQHQGVPSCEQHPSRGPQIAGFWVILFVLNLEGPAMATSGLFKYDDKDAQEMIQEINNRQNLLFKYTQ